jgi:hypothetical protein
MPEGYLGGAPLPWSWAEQQLVGARSYWVTTIASSGKPHVRPVWAIWRDDTVQFSTGARHAENIARDPRVTVNLDSGDDCVIVEGTAEATTNVALRTAFAAEYSTKYEWEMTVDFVDVLYIVRPRIVLGWIVTSIGPGATLFGATATRWTF